MKQAVSVSLGSAKRDSAAELDLLGERVCIERRGTDGDRPRMSALFAELDGVVDAFGLGGTDLALSVAGRRFPLRSVTPLVENVRQTPLVDGSGLKNTLERAVAGFIDDAIGRPKPRRVLITSAADRWGTAASFLAAGYEVVFGDLMFGLGLPVPIRTEAAFQRVAALIMPVVGRLPFEMLYPTGDSQDVNTPKFGQWYDWATVIAGDCHFIKQYMPARLDGKIICTNTTTAEDVALFRARGAAWLVTTTPRINGRSFGTNMLEAALVAASGKGRVLTDDELREMIAELGLCPSAMSLEA
jgi:hypothetical protein